MLRMQGKNNDDGSFAWKDSLLDAAIMAALTFFTAIGGLGATGDISIREAVAALIAGGSQFFLMLAIKRGLREKD